MKISAPVVSTEWLANNLGEVRIIDASWRMPGAGHAKVDYKKRHIPGALFFDIDQISDRSTDLPHMLPAPPVFEEAVGVLGVTNNDAIVVYDDQGVFSAPRVWWTFRVMGHENIGVLNGGLKKWLAEARPVSDKPPVPAPAVFKSRFKHNLIANETNIRAKINGARLDIADARSPERFLGEAPEPRAGLFSGAMPGAKNTPFDRLINDDGVMKSPEELIDVFELAGVALDRPVITTCGSGITAAVVALALEILGHSRWSLYDGSWAEWGKETNDSVAYPVVAGEN